MAKLLGKVALVTGASKGIGAAIARALAAHGTNIVVTFGTSKSGADDVVRDILASGGRAVAVGGDVADESSAARFAQVAMEAFGRLDVLVSNAGIYDLATLDKTSAAQFRRAFDTNVLGTLLVTQAASKHLGEGASVINISSVMSTLTPPGSAVYAGTKGAVDSITRVLAKELAPLKIRVNAISPGLVETEGTKAASLIGNEQSEKIAQSTPLGRVGRPDDIADVAVFLASDESRWITDENLVVSGGRR